jgi:transposase
MDIVNAYQELGTYRAAAALCGTTHKTVKRVLERRAAKQLGDRRAPVPRNTDGVAELVAERVRGTDGRISAKRLLPTARAAGYQGSARNFRRVVASAKAAWRRKRRVYRPWVPTPGEYLVIDWADAGQWQLFCAVLVWSRYRFVRFAPNQRRDTTLGLIAECFEEVAGVPGVVLADRMACLKGGVVANVVVPHPEYVRFATYYRFRPDFCEAADPESKGVVEALVGYAKRDLVIPALGFATLVEANAAAVAWCAEVNGQVHSEIAAVPGERLATEHEVLRPLPSLHPPVGPGAQRKVDKLATIRFDSARYSVPTEFIGANVDVRAHDGVVVIRHQAVEVACHPVVGPGEVALDDAHYGGKKVRPVRAVRPRTATELAFLALGPVAQGYLRAAAAAGTPRLATELVDIVALEPLYGRHALIEALARATSFRRFRIADVRAILDAGPGVPMIVPLGARLPLSTPAVPTRDLSAYALESLR